MFAANTFLAAGGSLVARNDFYTYPASIGATATTPGILINDVIPPDCDASLTITVEPPGPLYGQLTVEADGTFTYVPNTMPALNREEVNYTITCNGKSSTGVIVLIPTQGTDVVVLPGHRILRIPGWDAHYSCLRSSENLFANRHHII